MKKMVVLLFWALNVTPMFSKYLLVHLEDTDDEADEGGKYQDGKLK